MGLLVAVGVDVGQIVGDHIDIGLLGMHACCCRPERTIHHLSVPFLRGADTPVIPIGYENYRA